MDVLKNISVAILCFLLFLSLTIFGIAYTVQSTILSPDFISGQISSIPVSDIVREYVEIESPPEMPQLEETIYELIESLEPMVKERIDETIHAVYDYFPGDIENLELNVILRENFLTEELVTSIIDDIDLAEIASSFITEQFTESIPLEIENFDQYVEDAIVAAEPAIKKQMVAASGPVFDYILGIRQTMNVSISLDEVTDSLRGSVRQSLLDSPPPELASVPRSMRAELFDTFYDEIEEMLPSTFEIDNSVISYDIPRSVNEALTNTEEALEEASEYVSIFQTAYTLLIVFMAVLVVLIIVILRDVRKITRRLGVPLVTYGAIQYASIWIARLVSGDAIRSAISTMLSGDEAVFTGTMLLFFEDYIYQLAENILKPIEILSLVLLIIGIILVIVSYIYKRGEQTETI